MRATSPLFFPLAPIRNFLPSRPSHRYRKILCQGMLCVQRRKRWQILEGCAGLVSRGCFCASSWCSCRPVQRAARVPGGSLPLSKRLPPRTMIRSCIPRLALACARSSSTATGCTSRSSASRPVAGTVSRHRLGARRVRPPGPVPGHPAHHAHGSRTGPGDDRPVWRFQGTRLYQRQHPRRLNTPAQMPPCA